MRYHFLDEMPRKVDMLAVPTASGCYHFPEHRLQVDYTTDYVLATVLKVQKLVHKLKRGD